MQTFRRALAACAVVGLLAAACGDDDGGPASSGEPVPPTTVAETDAEGAEGEAASETPAELTVTLADGALTLSSETVATGAVALTFENETDGDADVDLTHVEDGTPVESFAEGFAPVLSGGPFPDFAIDNAGVSAAAGEFTTATVELDPGEYVVWSVPDGAGAEGPPGPEAFVTATLTVTDEEAGGAFPETEGVITATDYEFEAEVAGSGLYTFINDGPDQFHHAQIVDFGSNDPETVEEKLPEIIDAPEGAEPPEGIDPSEVDFEFATTGVFGPGGKTTFEADFEEGNTYAVVCFIQDRAGGPPHAIANDMYEVFQAG